MDEFNTYNRAVVIIVEKKVNEPKALYNYNVWGRVIRIENEWPNRSIIVVPADGGCCSAAACLRTWRLSHQLAPSQPVR